MRYGILLFIVLFVSSGASAFAQQLDEMNTNEKVSINYVCMSSDKAAFASMFLLAGAGALVSFVFDNIKEVVKGREKKYGASYKSLDAGTNLFEKSKDGEDCTVSGFEIIRRIKNENVGDEDNSDRLASKIGFSLRRAMDGTLHVRPVYAEVHYTKCRIRHDDHPTVDLAVTVSLECLWLDAGGNTHRETVSTNAFVIEKVPVTGPRDTQAQPKFGPGGLYPPLPVHHYRSGTALTQSEDTPYVLHIAVNEYDNYKKTVAKYGKLAVGAASMGEAMLQSIIANAAK
jgi:hypothetical protein